MQNLMQALRLKSLVRPKKYRSYRGQQASVPNILARQFLAQRPNQKWVTDVTEFNVSLTRKTRPRRSRHSGRHCPASSSRSRAPAHTTRPSTRTDAPFSSGMSSCKGLNDRATHCPASRSLATVFTIILPS